LCFFLQCVVIVVSESQELAVFSVLLFEVDYWPRVCFWNDIDIFMELIVKIISAFVVILVTIFAHIIKKRFKRRKTENIYMALWQALTFCFAPIVYGTYKLLNCGKVGSKNLLKADMAIECDTKYIIYASISGAILLPLTYFVLDIFASVLQDDKQSRLEYFMAPNSYKSNPSKKWFMAFNYFRTYSIMMIGGIFIGDQQNRSLFLSVSLMIFIWIHVSSYPLLELMHNHVITLCLCCLFLLATLQSYYIATVLNLPSITISTMVLFTLSLLVLYVCYKFPSIEPKKIYQICIGSIKPKKIYQKCIESIKSKKKIPNWIERTNRITYT